MPYVWSNDRKCETQTLKLWPHRSLPIPGFAAVILGTFAMMLIPLLSTIGTFVLWGLLPFLLLAIGGLWWGLRQSYHDGTTREELTISPQQIDLHRIEPNGDRKFWSCASYWVRPNLYENSGPVPHYITLAGRGREVEIGAFLSEDERKSLFPQVLTAIRNKTRSTL